MLHGQILQVRGAQMGSAFVGGAAGGCVGWGGTGGILPSMTCCLVVMRLMPLLTAVAVR